jgi:glycosyltransferase A (GT-A) superfamily protein (DUF2064 family)
VRDSRSDDLLLIAAREPVAGQTKTRLGATIGMERAVVLYAAFLRDLSARFMTAPCRFDVGWAFTPANCDFAQALAAVGCDLMPDRVRLVPQQGEGWGERQANLLHWGRDAGYARTILIASDSPQLSHQAIEEGFAALLSAGVALARTLDGGYSLIGMRGYHDVLSGVPMSTASAAEAIAIRCGRLGLVLEDLPTTFDVDEEADLRVLYAALAPDGAAAPETWAALQELDLVRELDLTVVRGAPVERHGAPRPG